MNTGCIFENVMLEANRVRSPRPGADYETRVKKNKKKKSDIDLDGFYIVMRDDRVLSATRRHLTFEAAQTEAFRLAQKEGVRFFVMAVMGVAEPVEPRPVRFREV